MTQPERRNLSILTSDLQGPLGEALYAGKMRATLISKVSGEHISLSFDTGFRQPGEGSRRWSYNVPFPEASHVFINVTNSRDSVGQYMVSGRHAGWLFPAKDWDTGTITTDPVRYWVAEKLLLIAAGAMPLDGKRYSVEQGKFCQRCGAELDEPESIAAGLGPVCRQMVSAAYGTRHQHKAPVTRSKQTVNPEHPGNQLEGLFVVRPGESLEEIYERLARS